MKITFRERHTNHTREVEYPVGTPLPKKTDHIVSPFEDGKIVTVSEVIYDAPRNCVQIHLDD